MRTPPNERNEVKSMKIYPENLPNTGYTFKDHRPENRSGHLSHALVEYAPGKVLAFYSNCSGKRNRWAPGHNGFGWLEYRRSADYGETWGAPVVFDYSMKCLLNEPYTVSCEKAVSPAENTIVALCIRNENPDGWEPYLQPVAVISQDGGDTWGEPIEITPEKGRIYDAFVKDGVIYLLMQANSDFLSSKPEHRYELMKSEDGGHTYSLVSVFPYLPGRAYGSMVLRPDGSLVVYIYNAGDEFNMDYFISRDMGKTWEEQGKSYCARRIRNPQVAYTGENYILHGRSGCVGKLLPMDFVFYTSPDGIHWDEGIILCTVPGATAYYSNNLVLTRPDGRKRVIIQSSVPNGTGNGRVNIAQWYIEAE